MGFPDLPFPEDIEESFIGHTQVLGYLDNYAQEFDLKKYVKVSVSSLAICLIISHNTCTAAERGFRFVPFSIIVEFQ